MFVSLSTLKFVQKVNLSKFFGIPVMDRYSVVVQILRLHATTNEARLQVALAEIPYIWSQMRDLETQQNNVGQNLFLTDTQKMMLKKREKNIQQELERLRSHRELLRNKRRQKQFPVVAVVGYTNCGKTSLIKALTGEASLQPRNQLFATLDVTAHAGLLPCRLEILYMDTVGFMTDLPTGLIECFIATLEDALEADIIIHVQDVAHEDWRLQRDHVEKTLMTLLTKKFPGEESEVIRKLDNIVNVGNKMDLLQEEKDFGELPLISSTTLSGINDLLMDLEDKMLKATDRIKMTIRVPMGGEEMQWLYKNTAVTSSEADANDSQKILLHVVISNVALEQFKHTFIGGVKQKRN
jgi:GTP-binding protein HflX